MTLEQLQDHAKNLEDLVATQKTELEDKDNKIKEVNELNLDLQRRNLSLFKQVEQRPTESQEVQEQTTDTPLTCEEYATKNYKELIK